MKKAIPVLLLVALLMGCGGSSPSAPSNAATSEQHKSPFAGTPGYILQFHNDFRSGMNAVDESGISVAIAMDVSGSMGDAPQAGGEPKYIQATKALRTVAGYLEDMASKLKDMKIRVCILRFNNQVDLVLPLTTLDADGIAKLNAAINPRNFSPNGGTAIGRAMEIESEILAESGTVFNSLMVVTDGENNVNPDPEDVMKAIYSNRNNMTTEDFQVMTSTQMSSFIGFDVRSRQFERFKELGARVASANSQAEIEQGLKSFLEADIKNLESK
jgi:Mg-chelatase subunit ChlD